MLCLIFLTCKSDWISRDAIIWFLPFLTVDRTVGRTENPKGGRGIAMWQFLCTWVRKVLWKCACGCVYKTLFWCGCAPHVRTSIFHFFPIKSLNSIQILSNKQKNWKKCEGAGARAGTKTGVRVRAPHIIKMCSMCVRVRPKIRAH